MQRIRLIGGACLLFAVLGPATTNLLAQCQVNPGCDELVNSIGFQTAAKPLRLIHGQQPSPDGLFTDYIIGLSYNRRFDPASQAFVRDDVMFPTAWLGLESYYGGAAELNIDLFPANSSTALRPFYFTSQYNGTATVLNIGGAPYASGASGITMVGGTGQISSILNLTDSVANLTHSASDPTGRSVLANMLQMLRQDNTASFAWRAGGVPRLNFALQPGVNANGLGNFGILKFAGEWDSGEPLIDIEATGTQAILFRSLPSLPPSTDFAPQFEVFANGRLSWGAGSSAPDTDLYRAANSTLGTNGNFQVGGNFAVSGTKSAVVDTPSYGRRSLYSLESAENWFEDFGDGRLVEGEAVIHLDDLFSQTVNTQVPYHVFLTPNGKCSLYVDQKSPRSFRVRSMGDNSNCAFDYRIVAKRRGYEKLRLATARE